MKRVYASSDIKCSNVSVYDIPDIDNQPLDINTVVDWIDTLLEVNDNENICDN